MPSSTPTSLSELRFLPLSSMAAAKCKARKQPGCKKSPVRLSLWPWTSRGDVATGHQPRLSHLWSSGKSDLPLASVWHRAICQRPWNRVRSATSSFLVMKALQQVTDLCKALLESSAGFLWKQPASPILGATVVNPVIKRTASKTLKRRSHESRRCRMEEVLSCCFIRPLLTTSTLLEMDIYLLKPSQNHGITAF